jgi:hypothetical protein
MCKPFVMRERDADYASAEGALRAGSTMRAEHLKYATWCPAPYACLYFWRRFEDWLEAQPDPRNASSAPPVGDTLSSATKSMLPTSDRGSLGFPGHSGWVGRRHAVGLRGQVAAKLVQAEIRVSPANACDVSSADRTDVVSGGSPLEGGLLYNVHTYWDSFLQIDVTEPEERKHFLVIEKHDAPCVVGFPVDSDILCPLFHTELSLKQCFGSAHGCEACSDISNSRSRRAPERAGSFSFPVDASRACQSADRRDRALLAFATADQLVVAYRVPPSPQGKSARKNFPASSRVTN